MREQWSLHPIGYIRSTLRALDEAPRQGSEGAPDAWLELNPAFTRGVRPENTIALWKGSGGDHGWEGPGASWARLANLRAYLSDGKWLKRGRAAWRLPTQAARRS